MGLGLVAFTFKWATSLDAEGEKVDGEAKVEEDPKEDSQTRSYICSL